MSVQLQAVPEQTKVQPTPLQVAQEAQIRNDLGFQQPDQITTKKVDPVAEKAADEWLQKLLSTDLQNADARRQSQEAVETIGQPVVNSLASRSGMLKKQISVLANAAESSPVAKAVIDLKIKVDEINPHRFKILAPGGISRLAGMIPFVGISANRYFTKFQSSGSVIESIVVQLREGAQQLKRDIDILLNDQVAMRDLTIRLQKTIQAAMLLAEKLEAEINKLDPASERAKFLKEEVLFPLRQTISDRQQNLAVNQQGVISYELIIRNNKELIRGARRCEEVTVKALEIAVVVAMALAHQRIVLKTIQAIDETTNNLILQNSVALKDQGTQIHKMAAGQSINMDTLKQSFSNLTAALEDISRFKQEALPQMAARNVEMQKRGEEVEKVIKRMESGNAHRPAIELELEPTGALNA